jgi:hypothetical protein
MSLVQRCWYDNLLHINLCACLQGSKHGLHLKPSTSNHNMSASVNTPRLSIASTDMNSVWEVRGVRMVVESREMVGDGDGSGKDASLGSEWW